jgi:hypothetical protein
MPPGERHATSLVGEVESLSVAFREQMGGSVAHYALQKNHTGVLNGRFVLYEPACYMIATLRVIVRPAGVCLTGIGATGVSTACAACRCSAAVQWPRLPRHWP